MSDAFIFDASLQYGICPKWEAFQHSPVRALLQNKLALRARELRSALESCDGSELGKIQASLVEVRKTLEFLATPSHAIDKECIQLVSLIKKEPNA